MPILNKLLSKFPRKLFPKLFPLVIIVLFSCKTKQPIIIPVEPVVTKPAYSPTQEIAIAVVDTIVLSGTLEFVGTKKLVIIVAGSGPTDRDCNSALGLETDAFKLLAKELSKAGISSYRYDKRGIGASTKVPEESMTLYDRVIDVRAVVSHFSQEFEEIILLGHSEGVTVCNIAAQNKLVHKYAAVSGVSVTMDKVIMVQMAKYPKAGPVLEKHFNELRNDEPFSEINPMFQSIFRESMRPFLKSAMGIEPLIEIAKVRVPTLIVNGQCDVQVPVSHALALDAACPNSELLIVEAMGHVLKILDLDCQNSMDAYSEPARPLNSDFTKGLIDFIKK